VDHPGGTRQSGAYVARMAPEHSAVPVFPRYDLPGQFEIIDQVAARCGVPLPRLRWNQPDGRPLGTAFFVMDHVDGRVPLDNPPYVFGGWLLEATPAEREHLQRASVRVLADLHAIAEPADAFPALRPPPGTGSLRWHVDQQRAYYRWALADDGIAVPIIERSLRWLDEHWPAETGPDVLSWGDARIGNNALAERGLDQQVGGYRIEVVEPLRKLRLTCQSPDSSLDFDLHWTGSFPAMAEDAHLLMSGSRPIVDSSRFCQLGSWSGRLRAGDREFDVSHDHWSGARDRSWGIRPVGEPEPPGRAAESMSGFWWLYMPLRFSSCALIVILQENPDGFRTLSHAQRIWADGRVEQLGWPRVEISYAPGTRHPRSARIHLADGTGKPVCVQIETLTSLPLHVGAGYNGDPDWSHGRWMGRNWSSASVFDLTDPAVAARIPWGVSDHLARASMDGEEGWGMFEHASLGRHDPTGFADWSSVAPG